MYYKVVRKYNDGRLVSATAEEPASITYIPNQWIQPNEGLGGIFVFDCLKKAKSFCGFYAPRHKIWECEVTNPQPIFLICTWYRTGYFKYFWKFYKSNSLYLFNESMIDAPNGSFIVDEIKLIKEVED